MEERIEKLTNLTMKKNALKPIQGINFVPSILCWL